MTNETIIEKAIEKAVKNGWEDFDGRGSYLDKDICGCILALLKYHEFIFSHSFAKAFWGRRIFRGRIMPKISVVLPVPELNFIQREETQCEEWEYHLQRMVLEEDPLQYLKKFL